MGGDHYSVLGIRQDDARTAMNNLVTRAEIEQGQGVLLWSISIFVAIASLAMAARLWAKKMIARKVEMDDVVMFLAWVALMGTFITCILGVRYGLGLHAVNVPISSYPSLLKVLFAFIAEYFLVTYIIKMSILLFYLKICREDSHFLYTTFGNLFNIATRMIMCWTTLTFLAQELVSLLQCKSISNFWELDPHLRQQNCISLTKFYYGASTCNILTDLMIFGLPLPLIWRLRGSLAERVGLIAIFLLGLTATSACLVRVIMMALYEREIKEDTYYSTFCVIWSIIEMSLGIVCACIPTFKPLFLQGRRRLSDSKKSYNTSSSGNSSLTTEPVPCKPRHPLYDLSISEQIRHASDAFSWRTSTQCSIRTDATPIEHSAGEQTGDYFAVGSHTYDKKPCLPISETAVEVDCTPDDSGHDLQHRPLRGINMTYMDRKKSQSHASQLTSTPISPCFPRHISLALTSSSGSSITSEYTPHSLSLPSISPPVSPGFPPSSFMKF